MSTNPPVPPYQPNPYPAQPTSAAPMNTLAIITMVLAFVFSPAGIVTGHIALRQIGRTGEQGRGLAKAGLIISYVFTGLAVLMIVLWAVLAAVLFASVGTVGVATEL